MRINKDNFVKELLNKNEKALEFVIEEYGALVNGIVRKVLNPLGDNGIIEECLSDVFFNVWNNINKFEGDEIDFKYWICGISKYKAIDYYRKYSKKLNDIVTLEEDEQEGSYNLEKEIIQNIETNEVIKLINKLKEPDKSIFVMKFLFDYSTKKIADILGLTISNVNTKVSRGREKLKKEYKEIIREDSYER